ncbi:MAG: bifunctional 2-polyprenyl-6-hydroxyphenol methylase/3-demethylubiquinol 3-O-methyltransferase UbiG [Alphaproteobacteria bacterium]|nr:bifunctional 2-polyprenyl-6-hydroxyphenol methylase/3-demethylubiquinol 3-O-methyltransferase UbiG [Alphaproteobacteria bacterium]
MTTYISPNQNHNHAIPAQVELFDSDAGFWWSAGGPFDLLHAMNPLRIQFIQDCVGDVHDLRILDVGCGGGILSEPLARLGAKVTGIDASLGAIAAAREHSKMMRLSIDYQQATIEEFSQSDHAGFDLVIASEIIEHVPNPASFLAACKECLAPDNKGIILSTINRTPKSYLGAILGAEYILRWVPRGTHEWNRFLKPSEIAEMGATWKELRGLSLNPCSHQWSFSKDLAINYIGWLK